MASEKCSPKMDPRTRGPWTRGREIETMTRESEKTKKTERQ